MMDYEDNYDEFERMLESFCYDIDLQMLYIQEKIRHYMRCYEEETTDTARKVCLEYIGKLNDMYQDYLVNKAYMILGLRWGAELDEVKRKHDNLFDRYKDNKDCDSIKMRNDIERAYDVLQCFMT